MEGHARVRMAGHRPPPGLLGHAPPRPAAHNSAPTVSLLLQLQRSAGNAAVNELLRRQPSPGRLPVQRLLTSGTLTSLAGQAKKDRTVFGKTVHRMSTNYKAVLSGLDAYHAIADAQTIPADNAARAGQVGQLQGLIDQIITSCDAYIQERGGEGRALFVRRVKAEATSERALITTINTNSGYHGKPVTWSEAIQAMGRVRQLEEAKALDTSLFHGTTSGLLGKFQGELLSGKELERRGLKRDTGEGDFFSKKRTQAGTVAGGGEKDDIFVGQGTPGMGTAIAYASAGADSRVYNLEKYTDQDLNTELAKAKGIIDHWDQDLNQVPEDDIMGGRKEKPQFQSLYAKLKAEADLRANLAPNHPRRQGQPFSESSYPLLFEFAEDGLDPKNPQINVTLKDDMLSPRPIGGERTVARRVDLRDPFRLKRVYCPHEKMAEVQGKLKAVLPRSRFEVIPLEALAALQGDVTKFTTEATLDTIIGQMDKVRQMTLEAYSRGMIDGEEIKKDSLRDAAHRLGLNQ